MIYLIDDKKIRQENYNWTKVEFEKYNKALIVIYTKEELDKVKNEIFSSDDIILFHDSFFDNPANRHEDNVVVIRQRLIDRTKKIGTVVFFGGAIGNRTITGRYASIPVNVLYNNLRSFLDKYVSTGMDNTIDMRYLVFGDSFDLEEIADLKERIWRQLYDLPHDSDLILSGELSLLLERLLRKLGGVEGFRRKCTIEEFKFQISKYTKHLING